VLDVLLLLVGIVEIGLSTGLDKAMALGLEGYSALFTSLVSRFGVAVGDAAECGKRDAEQGG
jgi:hypothetical protein